LGAHNSKGDIVLFLDADTILPNNFLGKAVKQFKERKIDVAGFYLKFNSKKPIYLLYNFVYNLMCFIGQYTIPMSVGAAIMVDKGFHRKLHGFKEDIFIGEDYEYLKRASKLGKFRILWTHRPRFSVRRIEKEGKIKMLIRWIYAGLYMLFRGSIKKKIVKYEFGKHE
jgi:cellulose synthase/poly-beta-1,6-N-acetylglucosamine synthase-like glycosyltransferase